MDEAELTKFLSKAVGRVGNMADADLTDDDLQLTGSTSLALAIRLERIQNVCAAALDTYRREIPK